MFRFAFRALKKYISMYGGAQNQSRIISIRIIRFISKFSILFTLFVFIFSYYYKDKINDIIKSEITMAGRHSITPQTAWKTVDFMNKHECYDEIQKFMTQINRPANSTIANLALITHASDDIEIQIRCAQLNEKNNGNDGQIVFFSVNSRKNNRHASEILEDLHSKFFVYLDKIDINSYINSKNILMDNIYLSYSKTLEKEMCSTNLLYFYNELIKFGGVSVKKSPDFIEFRSNYFLLYAACTQVLTNTSVFDASVIFKNNSSIKSNNKIAEFEEFFRETFKN